MIIPREVADEMFSLDPQDFANAIAAYVLEEAAKLCEAKPRNSFIYERDMKFYDLACSECAQAIRNMIA